MMWVPQHISKADCYSPAFQNFVVSLGPHVLIKMERLHTSQLFETAGMLPVIMDDQTTKEMIGRLERCSRH